MSWLDGVVHRLRTLIRPGAHERDLREEMEHHLQLGALQERDPRSAHRRFGNRTWYLEETRRMTPLASLDVLRQDLGYAWRSIRRSPGLTTMVVATLALGLGANAATFTLLDRVYLRAPSGVRDPGLLQTIWFETSAERSYNGRPFLSPAASYPAYAAIVAAARQPRDFALHVADNSLYMGSGAERRRVRGVFATASYFDVLGVRPAIGRLYTASEDSLGAGAPVVVISHRFWERAYGGDTAVLGRVERIEAQAYRIIGVLQRGFDGLDLQAADVWFPLASVPRSHWIAARPEWWTRDAAQMSMLRRVTHPGPDPAFDQLATHASRAHQRTLRFPDTLQNVRADALVGGSLGTPGPDMVIMARLGWVAAIVLAIACANVVNLLLARAVRRRREIAVRLALGISRERLVRLLVSETVLLALIAGAVSLCVAWGGGRVLRALLLPSVQWYDSPVDWRIVAFAFATAAVAGVVAGLVPALQASRPELTSALKDGTRASGGHRSRLGQGLVVLQAALSVVLLAGAALFIRSLQNVRALDIGYDTDRILLAEVSFEAGQRPPWADVVRHVSDVAQRLEGRPGIESVARSSMVPMRGISFDNFYFGADSALSLRPNTPTGLAVTGSFFRTVGMRFLSGAAFADAPGAARQVVVNEAMAKRVWPGAVAVGQCLRFGKPDNPCYTVSGVVENGRQGRVIEEPTPLYYLPLRNAPSGRDVGATLLVRSDRAAHAAAAAEISNALRAAYPSALISVRTMLEELEPEYRPWTLGARLFSGFGLLALLVAVIGVYSTVSYGVSQRTRDFGVRIALGARVADILRLVVGEGVRVVLVGVLVGVALSVAAGRLIGALLYDVTPGDPLALTAVAIVLVATAIAAALVPALRAARVDPVTTLRAD